ncbi:MAG: hypothetical protein APF77_20420 [Clostridia bacterium BRH_c25]|nr:MAG: hypothetical protein APF77_20420 [Clostridia bacterium BRH_c25]
MDNRHIYLVFTKTGTWLSRLISVFSDIRYPHASLSFDSDFTQMYSFGRINPNNPFSGGFVVESLYDGVYKKYVNCQCMIFRVRVTEKQYHLLQKHVDEFSKEKEKYRYNFLGLCSILFNKPIKRKNYYFCSQFVSEVLMKSKVLKAKKAPELTRTDDLYTIKNREIMYEGFVNEQFGLPAFAQV